MTASIYRPRSGKELIDATFELVRANFAAFATVAVIGYLPRLICRLIIPHSPILTSFILTALISIPPGIIAQGVLIHIASDAYLGQSIDIDRSLRASMSAFWRLLGADIAAGLLVTIGFLLFIVPGLILTARFFVVPAVVMLEEERAVDKVLDRSQMLCQDTRKRIIKFTLIVAVAGLLGGLVIGTSAAIFKSSIVTALLNLAFDAFAYSFWLVFMTLQYYDGRIRKEGYDSELIARETPAPLATT